MKNTITALHNLQQQALTQAARMLPPDSPKTKSIALALLKRHLVAAGITYQAIHDAPLLLGDGRAVYRATLKVAGITVIQAAWIQ